MYAKRFWILIAVLVVLSLAAAQCGAPAPTTAPAPATEAPAPTQPPPAETEAAPAETEAAPAETEAAPAGGEALQVAFVYVAPIGDLGWTWAHEQGRLMLEDELGDQVETAYIENVPEGPEAERVIRDFAQKGYDLIITTSFGYMDPTVTVAQEFPDTWFVHISGYKTADNVSTVFGRMEQARYLSGLVAGAATESNILGYVAAFPIPEVIRGINSFTLGVREVNPEAEVRVVWTNTWFGPPEEKEAAEALLAAGADVIAQHQDTTEPQKAAADAGAVSIGYDSDMAQFVGDTVLTSPVWNWGPKYIDIAEQVMAGTYATESYYGGMDQGIVDIAPLSARVPDDVKAMVEEQKDLIVSGKWDVFCGPVTGANGNLVVPEGNCMTDEELLSMDYFVEGVVGEAPKEAPEGIGQPSEKAMGKQPPEAAATGEEEFVFGVILVGPYNDHGWSEAHYTAGQYVEENLPGAKMIYLDKLNPADRPETTLEQAVDDMVAQGAQMIFTTSDDFQTDTDTVAAKYADLPFVMISGDHALTGAAPPNIANYMGRMEYGKMMAGCAAALKTQTGTIGYLGPLINDETRRLANSAYLGARYCYENFRGEDPDSLQFIVQWIGFWFNIPGVTLDPTEVANDIFNAGADVILSGIDTTEAIVVAGQRAGQGETVWAIPYDYEGACAEAPEICLGVPYFNWGPAYVEYVQKVQDGTFEQEWVWAGPDWADINSRDTTAVGFIKGDGLGEEEATQLDEFIAGLADGSINPFVGPLNYQDGSVYLEDGAVATDEQIWYTKQLLEGMTGPSE
jgi:simple sugar transport system substrate-binding protein